jgi:hypothetical protein
MHDNDPMAAWLKKMAAKTGLQATRVANVADYGDDGESTRHAILSTGGNSLLAAGMLSKAKLGIDSALFPYATLCGSPETADGSIRLADTAITISAADLDHQESMDAVNAEIERALTVLKAGGLVLVASDDNEARNDAKFYLRYHVYLHGFHKDGIPADCLADHLRKLTDDPDELADIPNIVRDYARAYA